MRCGGPGFLGLRVFLDVEPRQPHGPANQQQESATRAPPFQLIEQARRKRPADKLHAPGVSQNGGRDPEADDIGKRIEFAAELASRVRQTRDAAVEPVHGRRNSDHFRRNLEILRRKARIRSEIQNAVNRADDRR